MDPDASAHRPHHEAAATPVPGRRPGKVGAAIGAAALLTMVFTSCVAPAPTNAPVAVAKGGSTTPLAWESTAATHSDIAYGPRPEQRADIYLPVEGGDRGVLITVHGGGFVVGSRDEVPQLFGLAMRQTHRGFAVVNISYRLTDGNEHAFPAAVRDVDLAVEWVRRSGPDHGLNPDTVVVAGHSAGGTLAALVGVGNNSNPTGALGRTAEVDGWVSFAGINDFTRGSVKRFSDQWLGPNARHQAMRGAASPIRHLDADDAPGYVIHGDRDNVVPLEQTDALVRRGTELGIGRTLHYDVVTTGDGRTCRWHLPMCGANGDAFDAWLDDIVADQL